MNAGGQVTLTTAQACHATLVAAVDALHAGGAATRALQGAVERHGPQPDPVCGVRRATCWACMEPIGGGEFQETAYPCKETVLLADALGVPLTASAAPPAHVVRLDPEEYERLHRAGVHRAGGESTTGPRL